MPIDSSLPAVAIALVLALVIARLPAAGGGWPRTWSEGYRLPLLAGVGTALLTTWVWGGLRAPAVWHDEAAYLLQAELVAGGQFAAPGASLPAAFTQAAVLVTPVVAPKMMPGHAIVMAPGIWLGLPGLIPVLLVATTGALLVLLVRRHWGVGTAVIALAVWSTQAGQQRWRASYLSESTTGVLWLLSWWCLLQWRASHRSRWLVALAAAVGLGATTRPLTMLALFVPIGMVVLYDAWRLGAWRDVILAAAVGCGFLALVPLQNLRTLGDWRSSPLTLYTSQYMPFDRMGFGLDSTPPLLTLSPEIDRAMEPLRARHAEHQAAAIPRVLINRLRTLSQSLFGQWRILLIPAALAGLLLLPSTGWFALATAALLYVVYLGYAHQAHWSAYYAEATPVFAAIVAIGAGWLLQRIAGARGAGWLATTGVAVTLLVADLDHLTWAQRMRASVQGPFRDFNSAIAAEGITRGLIFIRHGASEDPNVSLVRNVSRPLPAPILTVYDRGGALNREVAQLYPDRDPYSYDTGTATLQRGVPE